MNAENRDPQGTLAGLNLNLESVLNLAADAILMLSEDQRILFFNESASRLFGYTPDEVMGQPLDLLLPERFVRVHREQVQHFGQENEVSRQMAHRQPVWGRRKDGRELPLEISISRQVQSGQITYAAIAHDITERLQAYALLERRVEERTRELERRRQVAEGLHETLALLNSHRSLSETLAHIVARACQEFSAEAGAIFHLGDDAQMLVVQEAQGLPDDYVRYATLPVTPEVLGQAVASRQPLLIPNMPEKLQAFSHQLELLPWQVSLRLAERYPVLLAVPLFIRDEFYGAITLYFQAVSAFSAEELQVAMMVGHQAALAIENARLYQQVQALAALEERQKLARELHDSVSQMLYGIALSARTARAWLAREPAKAAEPLEFCLSLAEAGLKEMRALIFELRPESLKLEGLVAAISQHAAAWQARYGIPILLTLGQEPRLPLAAKEALYRVTQEAFQNTLRHAQAAHVYVRLSEADQRVALEVKDDGRGFNQTAVFPGHWGLRSMQERMEQVGGRLVVESASGQGTCIRAYVPLGESGAQA